MTILITLLILLNLFIVWYVFSRNYNGKVLNVLNIINLFLWILYFILIFAWQKPKRML